MATLETVPSLCSGDPGTTPGCRKHGRWWATPATEPGGPCWEVGEAGDVVAAEPMGPVPGGDRRRGVAGVLGGGSTCRLGNRPGELGPERSAVMRREPS